METDTTEERGDHFRGIRGLALNAGEHGADLAGQSLVNDSEDNLALLSARLGHVEFQGLLQVVGHDTLRDQIDRLQTVGGRPRVVLGSTDGRNARWERSNVRPGVKTPELDHLAELVQALHRLLDLGQLKTDSVGLVHDLKDREAHRALEEQIIDVRHSGYAGADSVSVQLGKVGVRRVCLDLAPLLVDGKLGLHFFSTLKFEIFAAKLGHGPGMVGSGGSIPSQLAKRQASALGLGALQFRRRRVPFTASVFTAPVYPCSTGRL